MVNSLQLTPASNPEELAKKWSDVAQIATELFQRILDRKNIIENHT